MKDSLDRIEKSLIELKGAITMNNGTIAEEVRGLREDLVEVLRSSVDQNSGRIADGYIPLSTYVAHIEAYKDTYKFTARLVGIVVLSMFGLAKFAPDIIQHFIAK